MSLLLLALHGTHASWSPAQHVALWPGTSLASSLLLFLLLRHHHPSIRPPTHRELDKRLNDGKGEFDAAFLVNELPAMLGIEEKRVRMLLRELVGARKRMLLVQAVSQYRQKRPGDSVTSLNNLLSAYRAQPEEGLGVVQWGEREELKDLFSTYCAKVGDGAKQAELAGLFGLSGEEVADIKAGAVQQAEKIQQQQEEEDAFF